MTSRGLPFALLLATGCASNPAPPSGSPASLESSAVDEWDGPRAMPRGSEAPRARSAASAPGVDEPASPRPRLRADGRRIDVRFRDTELSNALRLLADAADLQLVVDDAVTGRVDLTLRGVTAAEALRIVAVAHGARVEHHGDVVVVRPP